MSQGTSVLVFFALTIVGQALTPSSYFTTVDQQRLKAIFEAAQPYADLVQAHYSIMGLKLLGSSIPKPQDACSVIKAKLETNSVESLFHGSSAAKQLGNCQLSAGNVKDLLTSQIKPESSTLVIYQAFFALKNLGLSVDAAAVSKSLLAALKKDDSALSYAYAFHVAAELTDVQKFYDLIEDVIAQADEVDEEFLQFEGGLFTTSLVLDGAYKLAAKANKAPTIPQDKVVKFTNYFLSRKHVHQLQAASHLLAVIKSFTDNKYHIPVAITLASPVSVSEKQQLVQVRVTDLLGKSIGKLTTTADSARHIADNAVVLNKKPFKPSTSDSSLYELNFMQAKPARGFYKLTVSAAPTKPDKRLIGTSGANIQVKVTTQVTVENIEVGVADKDQTSAAKSIKLQHPNKAANALEADHHQKILMKFQLKDKLSGNLMLAHQTFVRLTNVDTKQEIIFTASPETSKSYKFTLDVGASGKLFSWMSGTYSLELIVGDAVIENPFSWHMADLKLSFPSGSSSSKQPEDIHSKKPEIKHMFRPAEKRPPILVSNAFTILVLSPFLVLIILWMRIGVNVSNFPLSISAVGFHVCLAAIFGLYYCYWAHLNMFQTLRYLGFLLIPTFIFGNRLLNSIAAGKKKTN
ncbi:dolichyl-diphosphooligosaccharide--protein glycosyltransferase subunit 2-like [Tubulanus polymorphus]|uniref:dolichyl-diphosphooligosaccharide--protein glycosyltransferase subunit 2-like n=1 Tax=Tubulanus polymorphus TaxID=672921 RepID=UPI003DA5AFDC